MSIAELAPIAQYGLLGLVLGWFMWRNEKVLSALASTQEQLVIRIEKLCIELQEAKNQ